MDVVGPYALFYCRFGNLTRSCQILSSNGQVDLARRAELADELVWWSRSVIPLASLCLQCTQPLTFTCGLPDRRLFHLHRVRSTVKVIIASLSQIRIAPRARPHRTHRSCTDFPDFAAGEQDPSREDQVSPTTDYLLDYASKVRYVLRHFTSQPLHIVPNLCQIQELWCTIHSHTSQHLSTFQLLPIFPSPEPYSFLPLPGHYPSQARLPGLLMLTFLAAEACLLALCALCALGAVL